MCCHYLNSPCHTLVCWSHLSRLVTILLLTFPSSDQPSPANHHSRSTVCFLWNQLRFESTSEWDNILKYAIVGTCEMMQRIRVPATNRDGLSWISRTHVMEGENWLLEVVFWPPNSPYAMCTHTHINTINKSIGGRTCFMNLLGDEASVTSTKDYLE